MSRARKYPVELLERATRLVFESGRPVAHVAAPVGLDLRAPPIRVLLRPSSVLRTSLPEAAVHEHSDARGRCRPRLADTSAA